MFTIRGIDISLNMVAMFFFIPLLIGAVRVKSNFFATILTILSTLCFLILMYF
ncbi:MAG: hypothetical protein GX982_06715 [Tissierellia bacterium]|nr:hypothetical protein [Tissierellia bacterium]